MALQRVTRLDALWSGEMCSVQIEDSMILLARIDDVVVAYEDRCPHKGLPISDGTLNVVRVTNSIQRIPAIAPGSAVRIMNGSSHD